MFGIAILIAFLGCIFRRRSILDSSAAGQAQLAVHLTMLGATDLHAHIEPLDTVSNKPAQLALAKIAAPIRRVRTVKDTDKMDRTMPVVNALGYDAMAAGKIGTDTRVRTEN